VKKPASNKKNNDNLLALPKRSGQEIVQSGAVLACPLLGTDRFVKFCSERGLAISRERLIRLEKLRLFSPIFRVLTPDQSAQQFYIPVREGNNWFTKKWAWDTTGILSRYKVPDENDSTQEGYYSIFQINYLFVVLQGLTLQVQLDGFLASEEVEHINWQKNGANWLQYAKQRMESLRTHEYRRSVALLCQYISNRYYPQTQGDQRTIRVNQGATSSDKWITVFAPDWDWHQEARKWDPQKAVSLFDLTQGKLRHAYEGLSVSQAFCDPLERWYQLTQFISLEQRKKLKGDALGAETLRAGAHMLRLLYKDLYGEDLKHPNEITGTIVTHIPELSIREDSRRYLEFVVNRYGINPQPKLCLILEGQSEEAAVKILFNKFFGTHYGKFGIELIVLGGVDVATGSKKEDRFRAIFRLLDYLHHHQTITFLVLDNENYSKKLQKEAQKAKSIHSERRYVTRPEYIKIWKDSFEFDNFSCTEMTLALNKLSKGHATFNRTELTRCKNASNSGVALKNLFCQKSQYGLQKVKLSEILIDLMLSPDSKKKVENRPIVKVLKRVARLASRNPFPIMQETWERNQASTYLGRKCK
jgi:hypothetical protein